MQMPLSSLSMQVQIELAYVFTGFISMAIVAEDPSIFEQENMDGQTPENMPGVGGQEQKLARQHVIDHCGKP
jgi:hypothetical protein